MASQNSGFARIKCKTNKVLRHQTGDGRQVGEGAKRALSGEKDPIRRRFPLGKPFPVLLTTN